MLAAIVLAITSSMFVVYSYIAFRHHTVAWPTALSILIGVFYWYVIPGTIVLATPELAGYDSYLFSDSALILSGITLVTSTILLLLMVPQLLNHFEPQSDWIGAKVDHISLDRKLDWLLYFALGSAVSMLFFRFSNSGGDFIIKILVGLASARDSMTFENTSASTSDSLIALWEIVALFVSNFLACYFTWVRRTYSSKFATATAAIAILYAINGTRTILLVYLCSVVLAILCRPSITSSNRGKERNHFIKATLISIIFLGMAMTVALNMSARFEKDPSQADHILANSISAHNDMFRELLFSIENSNHYRPDGLRFLRTPITFAMPSFLGFNKSIPEHLIDFNFDRANIDLVYGEGNVFPGVIADFYISFGYFGPLVQLLFLTAVIYAFRRCAFSGGRNGVSLAIYVSLLSYIIASFRNIPGSLAILAVCAAAVSILLRQKSPATDKFSTYALRK